MDRTQFAGLTRLEAGESLQTDNGSFQSENPEKIDRLLEIGAVTHRHDAHDAQADPVALPSASAVASGGQIPGGLPLVFAYTLHDFQGGETIPSPLATVTTDPPIDPPSGPPLAEIVYDDGGTLLVDTYYYALSFIDGEGGETPIGDAVAVDRDPGFTGAKVELSDIWPLVEEAGAVGWRLWRAQGAGDYFLIGSSSSDDTFTDTGVDSIDSTVEPLVDTENFTNADQSVWVVVPDSDEMATASAFSLYMSATSDFGGPSIVGTYPLASAGVPIWVRTLEVGDERPPDVSTCVRGAMKIDPDLELLDWPWKRPVLTLADLPATTEREIRVVLDSRIIYEAEPGATGPDDWSPLYVGLTSLDVIEDGDDPVVGPFSDLVFIGSGGVTTEVGPGSGAGVGVVAISPPSAAIAVYGPGAEDGLPAAYLSFAGSAGTTVEVFEDDDDPAGVGIVITTSGAVGPPGADGSDGADGATGPPGPLIAREDMTFGASALASGAEATFAHPLHKGWRLLRVQANKACRIRAYPNTTYRTADAARAIGTDPTGDHGVLLDLLLPTGDLDFAMAPPVEGYNLEGPVTNSGYLAVLNMDATGDVSITFTLVQTE